MNHIFALQPGEVSAEAHRRGHGPISESRDGRIHPAVIGQGLGAAASKGIEVEPVPEPIPEPGPMPEPEPTSEPDDAHTYSGQDFDGIPFTD